MDYQITIDDPAIYTRSWDSLHPDVKIEGPLYEYACHEGNYAMGDIMRGARLLEAEEAAAKRSTTQQR